MSDEPLPSSLKPGSYQVSLIEIDTSVQEALA